MEPSQSTDKMPLQKIQSFFSSVQSGVTKTKSFFQNKRNDNRVMISLASIALIVAIYFLIQVIGNLRVLNQRIPQLINLDSYDTRVLQNNPLTTNVVKNINTIPDLIQENTVMTKDIASYTAYLADLQVPYTYFLQYIYLPSLNIRKDHYTQQINPDIIGLQFLQKNPYTDINLLQTWSDFFKNVGDNNESNDISDINIGDIVEGQSGYFSMPIDVSFVANSKRAFLLLVDKLSMTSNKNNISLINEFFYYLWKQIKLSKVDEIKKLTSTYSSLSGFTADGAVDKVIAYHLYNRIFNNDQNVLIDSGVIDKTVKSIISCNNQSDEVCYYLFREKYRTIPTFGYLIGTQFSSDPAQNFKTFVQNLPPLFSIKAFTFDKVTTPYFTDVTNTKYQGKITIEVYGRGISSGEIDEIAGVLGNKCFGNAQDMSVDQALSSVNDMITKMSDLSKIDNSQSNDLWQLKSNLEALQKTYPDLSPYKKVVKLFEVWRMINDAGLCK
jgi:hypothetical protein